MSWCYPRKITITRPEGDAVAAPGLQSGYGGLDRDGEITVFQGLPASVQHATSSGRPAANVPADAQSATVWDIFIPRRAAPPMGAIVNRDVVIDDLGNRYQVIASYPHPMGFTLRTERLEA
ncbi:hypothetical protein [Methylobacterium haplocladii]|uniref:Uncharacterized protein n=1 Tax=Methylobacterium haplocladii TaxID=1176176 RepID=A0A512ISJ3_9HYPH|nr:hypothetical protein [Methylobacterium haplocladii]GEP00651.1 hypothetical protein MHA02_30380 [Methylobacterium haplocladii]GJD85414.1 hypothetical protein HPGCJGGD_3303 [Methylobacterium haplocladii]GLS57799.1 hypothetical protein GCM10007887_04550 [Methylobacterium haplocladii]